MSISTVMQDALSNAYALLADSLCTSVVGWWLACAGLVALILLAGCSRTPKPQQENAYLFNLAKTSYGERNYRKLLQILQTQPIDVNCYTDPDSGMTLFLCACLGGNADVVQLLLEKGAKYTSTTTPNRYTALHLATYACCTVKSADMRILDLLACRGLSLNAADRHGNTPLSLAALYGKPDVINLLLQYGADPCISNTKGVLPLNYAVRSGNLEAAKRLEETMN